MQHDHHSPDYRAVRHLLTAPLVARRAAPHLRASDFDFEALAAETATMSGGEALLVRIAYELWNAEKVTGLWELARRLDAGNFERVVEALRIARGTFADAYENLACAYEAGEERAA